MTSFASTTATAAWGRLMPGISSSTEQDPEIVNPSLLARALERLKRIDRLLLISVVIPTALAVVYFSLIASDRYISESRFVVRSNKGTSTGSSLGGLLSGGGEGI